MHHKIPYHAIRPLSSHPKDAASEKAHVSFFDLSPESSEPFAPLDGEVHKAFSVSQFLDRKLRWVTLGGQYDWTQKKYHADNPPFPADIASFTQTLFPEMRAEAAIVNVYTPGDTLSMHRDVSEESAKGLVSISFGCDAVFVIGHCSIDGRDPRSIALRLRSGDAVLMSGSARFAWHGVPHIIPHTCPQWLRAWPAKEKTEDMLDDVSDIYQAWRDWMYSKRINLNIRQMRG